MYPPDLYRAPTDALVSVEHALCTRAGHALSVSLPAGAAEIRRPLQRLEVGKIPPCDLLHPKQPLSSTVCITSKSPV